MLGLVSRRRACLIRSGAVDPPWGGYPEPKLRRRPYEVSLQLPLDLYRPRQPDLPWFTPILGLLSLPYGFASVRGRTKSVSHVASFLKEVIAAARDRNA